MNKHPIIVKTIDYYRTLIYNFGIIIPGFYFMLNFKIGIFTIIIFILLIHFSSQMLFRRFFIAQVNEDNGMLKIIWSKNLLQKRRQDILIKISDIMNIEEPIQIGFYPTRLILRIKDNSDFKIFNPIFSFKDDYERFKGVLNAEIYYQKKKIVD
jgi:hypothetical protein